MRELTSRRPDALLRHTVLPSDDDDEAKAPGMSPRSLILKK